MWNKDDIMSFTDHDDNNKLCYDCGDIQTNCEESVIDDEAASLINNDINEDSPKSTIGRLKKDLKTAVVLGTSKEDCMEHDSCLLPAVPLIQTLSENFKLRVIVDGQIVCPYINDHPMGNKYRGRKYLTKKH